MPARLPRPVHLSPSRRCDAERQRKRGEVAGAMAEPTSYLRHRHILPRLMIGGRAPGVNWSGSESAEPHPCVAEHPHPRRVLAPASGCHDIWTVRNTRSGCGIRIVNRPSGVVRPVMPAGTVRVGRILLGRLAIVVDEAQRDERLRAARCAHRGIRRSLRRAQSRSECGCRHAGEKERRRTAALRERNARLELLRPVAHEMRPVLRTRESAREIAHHLATVAHASANVSPRAKNAANSSRARALNRIDFVQPSPAPSTSP